jgi:putative hydrolase of HD superfamily
MNILDFFKKVMKLKYLKRTGWIQSKIENPESVADHSFMLAILVLIYSKKFNLDVDKCVKLALIHDLCETYSGDIADKIRDEDQVVPDKVKRELERKGLKRLISFLPKDIAKEVYSLWEEFEFRKSKEGNLVKDLDKFEMCLQALDYLKKFGKNLDEFFEDGRRNIRTREIRKEFEKVYKEYKMIKGK